jgi:integrase/recombinase XerD
MNRWSAADASAVECFLRTQRFRNRQTRRIYGHILRAFQRFVSKGAPGTMLSVSLLQQWLQERRQAWPLHMVCHRARLVERFLEWSHDHGMIDINPFEELHRDYGGRTTPIVCALASDDSEVALQQLRPLPRFGSFMGRLMEEHVTLMCSLGYRYAVNQGMLLRFDRFLQSRPELAGESLKRLIEAWSESHPSTHHVWEAEKVGCLISKAMHRLDSNLPILPMGVDTQRRAYQQGRRPYQYRDEEVERLLRAALAFPSPKAPLRPLSLYTMLMLAYCAGLRVGEIVGLTLGDIHLPDETIEIRETKFFKYRRLPLPRGVMAALKDYLSVRRRAGAPMGPESSLFWNQQRGQRYSLGGVRILLVSVLRRAGLKPPRGKVGPRIHDLRHTMVGHRMREWYKDGINPQAKLPYLSTYLGHKDINSTLVYLNATPELLQQASERFRKSGAATLRAAGDLP